jgi:hypothetical protein
VDAVDVGFVVELSSVHGGILRGHTPTTLTDIEVKIWS